MSIHNKSIALLCAGLAMCSLQVGAARAQAVSFEEGQTFETGSTPKSVATGDFDGDGLPDLVTATAVPAPSRCFWATGMGVSGPPNLQPVPIDRW